MEELVVREAKLADIAAMLALWRRFWPPQPYESHLPDKIQSDADLVLVAELDGQVCATVIGGFDGWWAWIYRVAVAPEHHRKGIATQLIRTMHGRLRARGAESAGMVVASSNAPMVQLLARMGYHSNERHGVYGITFGDQDA
jgi:ribosomal protein S18 acetylase RimI-like enzyme